MKAEHGFTVSRETTIYIEFILEVRVIVRKEIKGYQNLLLNITVAQIDFHPYKVPNQLTVKTFHS